jgi:hypothetical protein
MWAALAARADKEGWPAARYERRSLLITANEPFGEWGKIFPDQAMTLAAIDRLVHHATILEMNVESYRRKAALQRKRGKTAQPPVTLRDRCQGSNFASLSGNTGHRAIFGAHRSVAIDPKLI